MCWRNIAERHLLDGISLGRLMSVQTETMIVLGEIKRFLKGFMKDEQEACLASVAHGNMPECLMGNCQSRWEWMAYRSCVS